MSYSSRARRNMLSVSAEADLLVALEIHHEDLEEPIRVVNDTVDLDVALWDEDEWREIKFVACPFDLSLPDDVDQQIPKATLTVDNIGRELTQWLEYSRGGKGAKVRILMAMRSYAGQGLWSYGPYADEAYMSADYATGQDSDGYNPWEFDMTLDMSGIKVDNLVVRAELGFQESFSQPAVKMRYDPRTAPGLW